MISDGLAAALGDEAQTGASQCYMIKDIADPVSARELNALRAESAQRAA
jgi:hypothetical protein